MRAFVLVFVFLTACGGNPAPMDMCPSASTTLTVDPTTTPELTIAGDQGSNGGTFDPSLAWPAGGTSGYASYTSAVIDTGLFTRIASTTDGKTFTYVADANAYTDLAVTTTDTSVCGGTTCLARMVHETSSLIADPGDPDPSRLYKLFDYSYVLVPSAASPVQHAWGYIGIYTAASPAGPWSAGTKAIGWSSTADALSFAGATEVLSLVSDLADCAAFTEPAALVDAASGDLELALGCVSMLSLQPRVVLVRSTDHARSWKYVGVLLSPTDGSSLGSATPGVMPSDFFQIAGTTYLIVSTVGTTPTVANAPSGYTSCTTVALSDLSSALVQRDSAGNPVVVRKLVAPGGTFAGACAFKPEFAAGYLVPEVLAAATPPNAVFESGVRCP